MTITINNQNFDLTEEQVSKLKQALGFANEQLADVPIAETFKVADIEWIKFYEADGWVAVVAKDTVFTSEFGNDNNFANSKALKKLKKEVLTKLEKAIGADNIKEFETDLVALDGVKTHGKVTSKISLPTLDFYRQYVDIFDKYKLDKWWWLATPWSALPHYDSSCVLCVAPGGYVVNYYYDYDCGVRPFCIFKSSIFVSR